MTVGRFLRGRIAMVKVFGLHEIELRPDADPDEYARFLVDEVAPMPDFEGWNLHLLRGDRGAREGKFAVLFEIESEEARDRYFPTEKHDSDEFLRFLERHPDVASVIEKRSRYEAGERATDYRVVGP
jgi:hypothetical protein